MAEGEGRAGALVVVGSSMSHPNNEGALATTPLLRTKKRCAPTVPYETGLLPRYLTTNSPSPPEVTTTIPDLKNG